MMRLTCLAGTGRALGFVLAGVLILACTSCGDVVRTGRSPVYLVIVSIEAASGVEDTTFFSFLNSDVQTLVDQQVNGQTVRVPTTFNDPGRVTFRIASKNPISPAAPTDLNDITVTRYRVVFRRSDGRNTPGVDVPYGFDGSFTVTVPANGEATGGFNLVRHQNKSEPPLRNLIGGGAGIFLSTIAEVTFFGRDQAGNEVSVTGEISVNFADFGDPQ
jgi:hypothetical protein